MVYEAAMDQLNKLAKHLKETPAWFILGGPGDANEAQCAVELWPDIRVIGFEPDPQAYAWQMENRFPGQLLPYALWNIKTELKFYNNGRMKQGSVRQWNGGLTEVTIVETITLDEANSLYGPFENAFLWLDIEGSEYEALLGAHNLFHRKAVRYANIELIYHGGYYAKDIEETMSDYNMKGIFDHRFGRPLTNSADRLYKQND